MFAIVRHAAHLAYPDTLTPEGQKAAVSLAEKLRTGANWRSIVASPKQRTRETAEILARELNKSFTLDERLLEAGDPGPWLPPQHPQGIILVTHLPMIRRLLVAWQTAFGMSPWTDVGLAEGCIISPRDKKITYVDHSYVR